MQYWSDVRLKGFIVALLVGAVACLALAIVTQHYWYPGPLFWADGGVQGLKNIAIVELVLGPILTAYLVAPKKTSAKIKLDLSIIVAAQLLAFGAGTYMIYSQRPVAVAYFDGSFHTISASALNPQEQTLKMLSKFGDQLPVWIYPETDAIDSSQSSSIFAAKDKWDEIKLGTSDSISSLIRSNSPQYLTALHKFHGTQNVIIVEGRYKTMLANVDDEFRMLDSNTLYNTRIN